MFRSIFKADPINAKEGWMYRYTCLEKGGSQDKDPERVLGSQARVGRILQDWFGVMFSMNRVI